jgi:hypothetical protein
MSEIALATWVVTILAGLFLLAIWLIEYDPDFQRAAATRLPVPVISGHAVLALGGLGVWVAYLITDDDDFAYATLAILAAVVSLGITMAVRWVKVYRTSAAPARSPARATVASGAGGIGSTGGTDSGHHDVFHRDKPEIPPQPDLLVPPERHFPLPVVIGHGLLALTTVTLVLITTLRSLSGR